MQDDDSCVRLKHQDGDGGAAELAATDVVHGERPEVTGCKRGDAPPEVLLAEDVKEVISAAEEAEAGGFSVEDGEDKDAVHKTEKTVVKDEEGHEEEFAGLVCQPKHIGGIAA